MHCNLKYPTEPDQINLSMIKSIQKEFGEKYMYGLSDHTMTIETPAFSLMLGANVVEKHYTVDKTLEKSADHWLSVDPGQVKEIVRLMDLSHVMMGTSEVKECTESEERARMYARRSVVTLRVVKAGEVFTPDNIGCKRPGTGISPKVFSKILGTTASQDIDDDTLLTMDDVNIGLGG